MPGKNIITINEQSSVKERLLKFIEYKRINPKQFEDMAGLSTSYISNMRKSIKPTTFDEKIAPVFPELNKVWLLHGEGNMLNDETKSKTKLSSNELDIKTLPHAEQMELLQNEILELKSELKKQREENATNTQKIIEFVDEYIKPVFDFMQESMENKKKDNAK